MAWKCRAYACQSLGDRRRMMREIIVHSDAAHRPSVLHTSSYALEAAQRRGQRVQVESDRDTNRQCRKRVADVVRPQHRDFECAYWRSCVTEVEGGCCA